MTTEMAEVHQAVLDYAEGWLVGDVERVSRALHDSFTKRRAVNEGFESFTKPSMLEVVAQGGGVELNSQLTIVVDEVSSTIATARCYSCRYLDLVHLGRFDGEWKLVHVLYRHRDRS